MQLPIRFLAQLTDALRRQAQPGRFPARLWAEIETQGCAYVHQVEDLVLAMDGRTHGLRLRELAHLAGYPVQEMYKRPRFKSAGAFSLEMVEVTDVVGFCIFLEQIGFCVDPGPIVDRLYAQIEAKDYLTRAQNDIYCYSVMRHKVKLTLQAAESVNAQPIQQEWRGASGHRYQCLVRGGQVTSLTIAGPRWRAPRHIELNCSVCGARYTKGDPESSLNHRTTHAKALRLLKPRPSKPMRERLQNDLAGERVDVNSPIWMHREVASRALRFKRDFGYDFLQWPSVTTRDRLDPRWIGYLFADADGAIDGACAFYCDKGEWRLDWVWVRPERRRHGLLASRWSHFLAEFGDFWIEHPISDEMYAFVARHGSQGQLQRIRERYPDGSPINNPD